MRAVVLLVLAVLSLGHALTNEEVKAYLDEQVQLMARKVAERPQSLKAIFAESAERHGVVNLDGDMTIKDIAIGADAEEKFSSFVEAASASTAEVKDKNVFKFKKGTNDMRNGDMDKLQFDDFCGKIPIPLSPGVTVNLMLQVSVMTPLAASAPTDCYNGKKCKRAQLDGQLALELSFNIGVVTMSVYGLVTGSLSGDIVHTASLPAGDDELKKFFKKPHLGVVPRMLKIFVSRVFGTLINYGGEDSRTRAVLKDFGLAEVEKDFALESMFALRQAVNKMEETYKGQVFADMKFGMEHGMGGPIAVAITLWNQMHEKYAANFPIRALSSAKKAQETQSWKAFIKWNKKNKKAGPAQDVFHLKDKTLGDYLNVFMNLNEFLFVHQFWDAHFQSSTAKEHPGRGSLATLQSCDVAESFVKLEGDNYAFTTLARMKCMLMQFITRQAPSRNYWHKMKKMSIWINGQSAGADKCAALLFEALKLEETAPDYHAKMEAFMTDKKSCLKSKDEREALRSDWIRKYFAAESKRRSVLNAVNGPLGHRAKKIDMEAYEKNKDRTAALKNLNDERRAMEAQRDAPFKLFGMDVPVILRNMYPGLTRWALQSGQDLKDAVVKAIVGDQTGACKTSAEELVKIKVSAWLQNGKWEGSSGPAHKDCPKDLKQWIASSDKSPSQKVTAEVKTVIQNFMNGAGAAGEKDPNFLGEANALVNEDWTSLFVLYEGPQKKPLFGGLGIRLLLQSGDKYAESMKVRTDKLKKEVEDQFNSLEYPEVLSFQITLTVGISFSFFDFFAAHDGWNLCTPDTNGFQVSVSKTWEFESKPGSGAWGEGSPWMWLVELVIPVGGGHHLRLKFELARKSTDEKCAKFWFLGLCSVMADMEFVIPLTQDHQAVLVAATQSADALATFIKEFFATFQTPAKGDQVDDKESTAVVKKRVKVALRGLSRVLKPIVKSLIVADVFKSVVGAMLANNKILSVSTRMNIRLHFNFEKLEGGEREVAVSCGAAASTLVDIGGVFWWQTGIEISLTDKVVAAFMKIRDAVKGKSEVKEAPKEEEKKMKDVDASPPCSTCKNLIALLPDYKKFGACKKSDGFENNHLCVTTLAYVRNAIGLSGKKSFSEGFKSFFGSHKTLKVPWEEFVKKFKASPFVERFMADMAPIAPAAKKECEDNLKANKIPADLTGEVCRQLGIACNPQPKSKYVTSTEVTMQTMKAAAIFKKGKGSTGFGSKKKLSPGAVAGAFG